MKFVLILGPSSSAGTSARLLQFHTEIEETVRSEVRSLPGTLVLKS